MCIFTRFRYLCLHEKFKIAHACDKAALDRNGVLTCPDDPSPQIDDRKNHMCGARTYGIGVCASIHCAWHLSILPLGDYGDDKVSGQSTIFEDDTEIDDSLEAREDRVSRWYHLLDADQQLDHYQTEYPLPYDQRSSAGRALLEFPYGAAVTPLDSLQWKELNPKLLNPSMLQWCVFHRVLPASVVDGRKSKTTSPIQPTAGPFKLTSSHKCRKKHGICKKCGANIGNRTMREKTMAYRQNAAFTALENEDSAKGDLKGSVWDPSVDLKWDDEKGVYVKVQTTNQDHDFQTQDEPYAANNGDLVFASSTPQAVVTSDGFYGQDTSPLDEDVIFSGMELGFPDGMDWQDFTEAPTTTSLVTPIEAIAGEMYCPGLDFPHGPAGVPSSSLPQQQSNERLREPFHLDPSISFTEDPTATAEHIDFAFLGSGTVFGDFDGGMSMDAVFDAEDNDYNNQDETASEFALDFPGPPGSQYIAATDPYNQNLISSQTPGPISSSATSTFPGASYEKQVEHFVAEQQIANATDYQPSAETLRVVVQMVRQAAVGGVSRPSYDNEANQILEMMMQHAIAGLL